VEETNREVEGKNGDDNDATSTDTVSDLAEDEKDVETSNSEPGPSPDGALGTEKAEGSRQ
jgi:hypothetical protein